MINPFVEPDIVRLALPGDHWIEVKRELSYGEEQDMYSRMRRQVSPGEVPTLDPMMIGAARMEAYILGWSFTENGKSVPVSTGAFRQLKPRMARAIREALEQHEEAIAAEQEAEKKTSSGEPAPSRTLQSVK
jgi:hypothetical protein